MIETILKEHSGELLSALKGPGDLSSDQAENLLPPALSGIGDALTSGDLDLGALLSGGDVGSLMSKLDLGDIASKAGLDESQARGGLQALIPVALSLLGNQAGGAQGLLSMLGGESKGGVLGALSGLAGRLSGNK